SPPGTTSPGCPTHCGNRHPGRVDARQLEYFRPGGDGASVSPAPDSLSLAQPSLSQAIRNLERELGTELFHRIGRRIELTEAGRALIAPPREGLRDPDRPRAA